VEQARDRSKVSIIVLNWNGKRFLADCLEALRGQTHVNREIILVDNGSTDLSVQFVKESFPDVKIVELSENVGFSGGNLEGLKVAGGEFTALVNNDARVDKEWLERLIQPMVEDSKIGVCASKLILEGTRTINSAGGRITTAGVGFDRGFGESDELYNIAEFVFGACAAAVLYRRKMLEEIGFFDEDFFLYGEDTDLSFRAQLAGWKCMYVPTAVVYHKGHATAGRYSDLHVYHHTRNQEFVWLKNMPAKLMIRYAHHKILQEMADVRTYCLRLGKWRPFLRAKRDAIKMLPGMLKKRRAIQGMKKVSDEYTESLLTSIFSDALRRHKRLARLAFTREVSFEPREKRD
jgi:GT2 family glycosyltransferase